MNDIIQSQGLALSQASQYQQLDPAEYQQGAPTQLAPIEAEQADMSGVLGAAKAYGDRKRQKKLDEEIEKGKTMTPSLPKNSGADAGKVAPATNSVISGNGMNDMLGGMGIGKTMPNSPIKPSMSGAAQGGLGAGMSAGAGASAAGGAAAAGGGAWSKIGSLVSKL